MKTVVDQLNDTTGWVGTGSVSVSLNEVPGYLAGNGQSASLLFHFPAGSQGESITKILGINPVDVTDYDKLIFSTWSRNKGKTRYRYYADCRYRLRLNSVPDERYIRTWKNFTQEEIDISDVDVIDELTFICEHNDDDYLLVSLMVAEVEQSPYDLLIGVQEALDYYIHLRYDPGLLLSDTLTATAGAESVELADSYLDRYAVVQFGETGELGTEVHMLGERNGPGGQDYTFGPMFDGTRLLASHSDSPIYLLFPVGIGGHEAEVTLPGISLWSMTPNPVDRGNDLDEARYNFTETETGIQPEGKIMFYPVLIDCEARQYVLLELLTARVRAMMSTDHTLWINGRKHDIEWTEVPVDLEPTESQDITPKVQYTLNVEIKEELWRRTSRPLEDPATVSLTPILQGQQPESE